MSLFSKFSSTSSVRFKEQIRRPGALFGEDVCDVYEAPTVAAAKRFLAGKEVTRQQHYIIVETPEGVFGKDRMGEFDPSRGY